MATSPDPEKKEHPSTYMVQDRSNYEEMLRIDEQDKTYTKAVGLLPEQTDPTRFQRVLDVGCGTGGWLIEMAKTYPDVEELRGVDISGLMIDYARTKAEEAQVSTRVHFQTGDALRRLEFPTDHFDLVNQRLGMSFLRKWDWPNILREYQRVCKPGGTIRIMENAIPQSNSPAMSQLFTLFQQALYQAGHLFEDTPEGVINHMAEQMEQYGITDVQSRRGTFVVHSDPQMLPPTIANAQSGFRTLVPFLRKWAKLPDNYNDLYQQMLQETQQPGFEMTIGIVTAWGTKHMRRAGNRE